MNLSKFLLVAAMALAVSPATSVLAAETAASAPNAGSAPKAAVTALPAASKTPAGLPRTLNFSINAGGFFLPGGMEANIDQLSGGAVSLSGGLGFKLYNYAQIDNFLTASVGFYIKPSYVTASSSHAYVRVRVGLVYAHGRSYENINLDEGTSYRAVSWQGNAGLGYRFALSERVNITLGAGAVYSGLQSDDIRNYSGFMPNAEFGLGFSF